MTFDLPISGNNFTKLVAGLTDVQKPVLNNVTGVKIFSSNPSKTASTGELPSGEVSGAYAAAKDRAGEVMVQENKIASDMEYYVVKNPDGSETHAYQC